jgi:hypothetical protein
VTLASPHFGSRQHAKRYSGLLADSFSAWILRQTGKDLMLLDHDKKKAKKKKKKTTAQTEQTAPTEQKEQQKPQQQQQHHAFDGKAGCYTDKSVPILVHMTREPFTTPLALFQTRLLYANICGDVQVQYSTASMQARNPYAGVKTKTLPRLATCPHMVDRAKFLATKKQRNTGENKAKSDDDELPKTFASNAHLRELLVNMTACGGGAGDGDGDFFRRFDIVGRLFLAHTDVVCRTRFNRGAGRPLVAHLMQQLKEELAVAEMIV